MKLRRDEVITPDDIINMGDEFLQSYFEGLPPEQIMRFVPPEQRMAGLPPEQIMSFVPPEQRMAGLPPEQIMAGLAGVPQQDILTYLDPDEMEKFLKNRKRKNSD